MPKMEWIKKVLVLGSGAIKIGEAAEFDYSGSQALKALREEQIETVLVNPNIATIQTDPQMSDKVYLLPVTPHYVSQVIRKERPDGILLGFGGQTSLNCGVELQREGILEEYDVKVLGTPIRAIEETEDRELFKQAMARARILVPESQSAKSVEEAKATAAEIGYPVIVRVAYTLGGKGSGVAFSNVEFDEIAGKGLAQSRIQQILVEKYIGRWKEIEYEVVRDTENNCLTVCNMENLDPMGIHTGDSIVVAPSQTLTNQEYHMLRSASIRTVQSLGIVGECNIQWALNPRNEDYRAVEINARMSRSSALASKATGYPLAYVAAKLAVGHLLPELKNKITNVTTACFEPALDYVVVKIPRWDLEKFRNVDSHLGPQMKSIGEVMAIGRCFEEALMKAVRMLENGNDGLNPKNPVLSQELNDLLSKATDERLFYTAAALRSDMGVEELNQRTGIDPWFLHKIKNIIDAERKLQEIGRLKSVSNELLKEAKCLGFSDAHIAQCLQTDEASIRRHRLRSNIRPCVKQIDTLAAEWPAKTNYLYVTYGGQDHDIDPGNHSKALVLGSGVFRIGSSVEFDWCAVNTVASLRKHGVDESIIVNCNPETVSTDFNVSDKLYFEELTLERILDIYEFEKPMGVIVSVGGQTPNNLAMKLYNAGVKILGTGPDSIDRAENRAKFSRLLDQLGIPQPVWNKFAGKEEAKRFSQEIGYPVLVRPSYVLSGSAMRVAYDEDQLEKYLDLAARVSPEHPVAISKFIREAKELDVDGISDGETVLIGSIIEHIERAGVHSGDATMVIPPQTIDNHTQNIIEIYTSAIARALKIRGPFNMQFLVKNRQALVIECNLRASRTMPFTSKTIGLSLIEAATGVMLGKPLKYLYKAAPKKLKHVAVKCPQFSFMRLTGADPVLGVEMMSTGEVACFGDTLSDALLKAMQAAEIRLPREQGTVLVTVGGAELKQKIMPLVQSMHRMGYMIYATEHTAEFLRKNTVTNVQTLYKVHETERSPNVADYIRKRKIDLVINIPGDTDTSNIIAQDEYSIRRIAVEYNVPIVTNLELAKALVKALQDSEQQSGKLLSLQEYTEESSSEPPLGIMVPMTRN